MRLETTEQQRLVNLCFSLVLAATSDKKFCKKSTEQKAEWVAEKLKNCGFETTPVGASWGVLINIS